MDYPTTRSATPVVGATMAFSDDVPSVGKCAVSPISVSDRSSPTANALWPSAPAARSATAGRRAAAKTRAGRIEYSGRRQVIWECLWRSRCEWTGWQKIVADCVFQAAAAVMIWFQTAKRLVISVRHPGALIR